jgi:hypothetical protein
MDEKERTARDEQRKTRVCCHAKKNLPTTMHGWVVGWFRAASVFFLPFFSFCDLFLR